MTNMISFLFGFICGFFVLVFGLILADICAADNPTNYYPTYDEEYDFK